MQQVLPRHFIGALGVCLLASSHAQAQMMKPQQAQIALGNLPMRAMWALESNDLPTLARLTHSQGIRFSPYIYAAKTDLTFTPSQIRALRGSRKYLWGSYDGTGAPIRLSWAEYRRKFVWDRDFSTGQIRYNFDRHQKRGNTINNLREAYKDAIFVQSYKPGTKKYAGMDWSELWTVWKRENGQWRLRGIAHNEWTT